jgi:hypothetical protein
MVCFREIKTKRLKHFVADKGGMKKRRFGIHFFADHKGRVLALPCDLPIGRVERRFYAVAEGFATVEGLEV